VVYYNRGRGKKLLRYRGGFRVGFPTNRGTGPIDTSLGGGVGSGRPKGSKNRVQYKDYSAENQKRRENYSIDKQKPDGGKSMPQITQEQLLGLGELAWKAWAKTNYKVPKLPQFKWPRSKTRRKQNTSKMPNNLSDNVNDKISYSSFKMGKLRPRRRTDYSLTVKSRGSIRFVVATNRQGSMEECLQSRPELVLAATRLPIQSNAIYQSTTAHPSSLSLSNGMTFASVVRKYTIASSSNVLQKLIIYDIMPRRDLNHGVITTWDKAVNTKYMVNNSSMTSEGYGEEYSYNIGSSPTKFEFFNRHWKVLRRTVVKLSPGEVHVHTAAFNLNKYLAGDYIIEDENLEVTNDAYIGWTSPFTLFTLMGSPVHDTDVSVDAGKTENGNIGYSKAAVDILHETTSKYIYSPKQSVIIYRDLTLTAGAITAETSVDEDGTETTVIT